MQKITAIVLASAAILSACSTASKNISATYVSPMQYQSYDCDQLTSEALRIQTKANQLAGRLDQAASNDKTLVGVGAILFWPALFALGGTKEQETEYARLKGEYDAIEQASIAQKCPAIPAAASTGNKSGDNTDTGSGAGTADTQTPAQPAQPAAPSSPASPSHAEELHSN